MFSRPVGESMVSRNTFEAAVNAIKSDPAVVLGSVFPSFPEREIRADVEVSPLDNTLAHTVADDAGENVELDSINGTRAVYRVVESDE